MEVTLESVVGEALAAKARSLDSSAILQCGAKVAKARLRSRTVEEDRALGVVDDLVGELVDAYRARLQEKQLAKSKALRALKALGAKPAA